jgi:hypothetical protein
MQVVVLGMEVVVLGMEVVVLGMLLRLMLLLQLKGSSPWEDRRLLLVMPTLLTREHASIAAHKINSEWVLDSGASQHVAGDFSEFTSYTPHSLTHPKTIHTADGTAQPIRGVGRVSYIPSIKLSSVLHVPAFPINLLSLSALVDQIDCNSLLTGLCS